MCDGSSRLRENKWLLLGTAHGCSSHVQRRAGGYASGLLGLVGLTACIKAFDFLYLEAGQTCIIILLKFVHFYS